MSAFDLLASAARTVSGSSASVTDQGDEKTLRVQLNVTAASGTSPTLNAVVEDTLDGINWNTIGTFAQRTGTGREVINITTPFSNEVRVSYTIGGTTPSFTFSVVAYSE